MLPPEQKEITAEEVAKVTQDNDGLKDKIDAMSCEARAHQMVTQYIIPLFHRLRVATDEIVVLRAFVRRYKALSDSLNFKVSYSGTL